MTWLIDVRHRNRQPEIMDQPGIDRDDHVAALRGLERINWWSRSAAILWPTIRELARAEPTRTIRVLDLATGAGDIPIALCRKAKRDKFNLSFAACDCSETALDHARRRADESNVEVRWFQHDVLSGPIADQFDVVVCSLFLHHLEPNDAVVVLNRMRDAAARIVRVNDLNRSRLGWWMARLGTVLLTRSAVARADGPRSVEGAFSRAEALELAERAGLRGAAVVRRWPCRWLMTWRRTGA
jgi:2-polyprenyl-3-methyl-5-hydroxy-6-metoxy-1,4-benzoquinol methylase